MDKLLTVIITFLNEKEEVKNTIDSLIEHINNDIDIILINDNSDDDYDYQSDIKQYDLIYIENDHQMGVAYSRDKGVGICQTPYFLFLDAHMRFVDCNWYDLIITELGKDDRSILCCQTMFLKNKNGIVVEDKDERVAYGAYLNLKDPIHFFELQWQFRQSAEQEEQGVIDIPCIIGAGYAVSKRYWTYLHGLWGLKRYGLDEAYISMKIWLEGGRCKLIKDFIVGHIYRLRTPYVIEDISQIYNKLLLLILLTPNHTRDQCFAKIKQFYPALYRDAFLLISQNKDQIVHNKDYYKKILVNKYESYYQLNYALHQRLLSIDNKQEEELQTIANCIRRKSSFIRDQGLINGKAGILLFLFHYARYSKNKKYWNLSRQILDEIIVNQNRSISFDTGILGVGWCFEYLYQNDFISETAYLKFNIEKQIFSRCNLDDWEDFGLYKGFGGLVRYILAKLYTQETKSIKTDEFDTLKMKLYEACSHIIDNQIVTDCTDTYLAFIWYIDQKNPLSNRNSIYHVLNIYTPDNFNIKHLSSGLDGLSGIGLSKILNIDHQFLDYDCRLQTD